MRNRVRTFFAAAVTACILAAGIASPTMAIGIAPVGVIDEASALVDYTVSPLGWTSYASTNSTDGHVKYASAAGASATLTFAGRIVTWLGWKKESAGKAEIYIDNVLKATVDNYSAVPLIGVPVWTSAELEAGTHTMEVRALGTKNAAATDDRVFVDGFIVSDAGTYENTSDRLTYTGSWTRLASSGSSGGGIDYSTSSTATVSLDFTGPDVSWYTWKSTSGGDQKIYIDDVLKLTFDNKLASGSTQTRVLAFTARDLSAGAHNITVKSPDPGTIQHDSFVVGAGTPVPAKTTADYVEEFTTPPAATVTVTTSAQLATALADAGPGTVIQLADDTTFTGPFKLTADGSETAPIWVVGPRSAVVTTGDKNVGGGIAFFVDGGKHVRLSGFTVSESFQGVWVKSGSNVAVANLHVHHIGYEAIHLRIYTTDSYVVGNLIEDTGFADARYGEGVYIGTSPENWNRDNNGDPDVSSRNMVAGNTINRTGAEQIEPKAGTADGIIRDNVLNGYRGNAFTNAMILVGGDNYDIIGNSLTNARDYGLATIQTDGDPYGNGNSWRVNTGSTFTTPSTPSKPALGYRASGTLTVNFACDNIFTDDDPEFLPSNVWCTP